MLLLLFAASTATAQSESTKYKVVLPEGEDWTATPSEAESGKQVTIKYSGSKKVHSIRVVYLPMSVTIEPSCLVMTMDDAPVTLEPTVLPENAENKTVSWVSDDEDIATIDATGKVTPKSVGKTTITVTTNENNKTAQIPVAILNDNIDTKFSVSESKQVYFSKGNLQYNPKNETWRFAENQWDVCHQSDDSVGEDYASWQGDDKWTDLFGWGMWLDEITDKAKIVNTSQNKTEYAPLLTDDGTEFKNNKKTLDGIAWQTLLNDEWEYLINTRTTAKEIRYTKANVHGVDGLVLLPDQWSGTYSFANTNKGDASFVTISDCDWTILEKEGAVFLPTAGYRLGTSVGSVGTGGVYWSSSAAVSETIASVANVEWFVGFTPDDVERTSLFSYYGFSVRLVRPSE